jgi:hypothetical protein
MLVEQAESDRRGLVQSFEFSELLPRSCLAGPQDLFDALLRGVNHVEGRDDVASLISNWHEGVRTNTRSSPALRESGRSAPSN